MRLDNLPEPETLWYEDQNGEKMDFDLSLGCPESKEGQTLYQHSESACVRQTICGDYKEAKWPIRFLKWLSRKMPNSWQGRAGTLAAGETTINCLYPVVKYLVEERDWHFSDACVSASRLCERCMNICLWECEGHDYINKEQHYLSSAKTYCRHCNDIDQDYAERYRVWCCYRTLKLGGGVSKAWNEITVDSAPGYRDVECERKPNVFEKIQSFFGRFFTTYESRA